MKGKNTLLGRESVKKNDLVILKLNVPIYENTIFISSVMRMLILKTIGMAFPDFPDLCLLPSHIFDITSRYT